MADKVHAAKEVAKPRSHNGFWLDHAKISESDFDWLCDVERLTLWNVKVPKGFLARLDRLWWLDIRGGSSKAFPDICNLKRLRYLAINQVRGLSDLSVISEFQSLEMLMLYGLPQVTHLPSLHAHDRLKRVELGQMKGLESMSGVLHAPSLREFQLMRKVKVSEEDIVQIGSHPTLEKFGWVIEDVPVRVWEPVLQRIDLARTKSMFPEDWFGIARV